MRASKNKVQVSQSIIVLHSKTLLKSYRKMRFLYIKTDLIETKFVHLEKNINVVSFQTMYFKGEIIVLR